MEPPRDANSLPAVDVRRYRPQRLPRHVAEPLDDREVLQSKRSPPRAPADQDKTHMALWKTSVRDWMQVHDVKSAAADWELPKADERVLLEWFDAIDIDRSGDVDADEIRALLASNQIGCSPARLEALFHAVGKRVDEGLTLHDFVKLMHVGGGAALFLKSFVPPKRRELSGPEAHQKSAESGGGGATATASHAERRRGRESADSYGSYGSYGEESVASAAGGESGGGRYGASAAMAGPVPTYAEAETSAHGITLAECRSDGDLAVLTYRRQRVLRDLQSGTAAKRSHFQTREAFQKRYAPSTTLPTRKQQLADGGDARGSTAGGAMAGSTPPMSPSGGFAMGDGGLDELTDAEQRMAADGNFFRHQINLAKEAEAKEAERIAAEEKAEEERKQAELLRERRKSLRLPAMATAPSAAPPAPPMASQPGSSATVVADGDGDGETGGGGGGGRQGAAHSPVAGRRTQPTTRKRAAAAAAAKPRLSYVASAKTLARHHAPWPSEFAQRNTNLPRAVSLPAL